ncbi:hypothetical protein [Desulfoluna spongiiphila]|uniref:hypothetical protein n=1 Tax=Desulfoluna spongiiphila TaxID=419481 RepID=UPI001258407E|nr:hypothetical protein [Desulfoluna spongiiphila]VVS93806.1 hypothetical protein DBB_33780 [Desulfoluna spongiiphila]
MCPPNYDFGEEAKETDNELLGDMDKLVPLTDEELAEMLPNRAYQEELKALIEAVGSQATTNAKKAVFIDRSGAVSAIVKDCALKIIGAA